MSREQKVCSCGITWWNKDVRVDPYERQANFQEVSSSRIFSYGRSLLAYFVAKLIMRTANVIWQAESVF